MTVGPVTEGEEITYLPAGVDEIGTLANELGNLTGYDSLANELIQNADDAEDATSIVFDVRADALVVENDGEFSDCGDELAPECPWFPERQTRCSNPSAYGWPWPIR